MKIIKQKYLIDVPIEKVWEALTNPKIIAEWGGGPAKMSAEENFNFSLWGGDIHGKNIRVIPQKLLKQEWISDDWDKPSIMTFELSGKDGKTLVELIHTDVPEKDIKDIENGWKTYYMGPLKELLEG